MIWSLQIHDETSVCPNGGAEIVSVSRLIQLRHSIKNNAREYADKSMSAKAVREHAKMSAYAMTRYWDQNKAFLEELLHKLDTKIPIQKSCHETIVAINQHLRTFNLNMLRETNQMFVYVEPDTKESTVAPNYCPSQIMNTKDRVDEACYLEKYNSVDAGIMQLMPNAPTTHKKCREIMEALRKVCNCVK